MRLEYTGKHQPQEIIEVPEGRGNLLLMTGMYKVVDGAIIKKPKKKLNKYNFTERDLFKKTKEQQIDTLQSLGWFDIPKYEEQRVKKILELQ